MQAAGLVAIALATLALSLACLRACCSDAASLRWAAAVAGVAAGAGAVAWFTPIDRIVPMVTVLHEGGSARTLGALFAQDAHVGPLWRAVAVALSRADRAPLIDLVRLNLALTGVASVGLAAVAARATGSLAAAALTFGLFVDSRGVCNASLSETPAPLLWCLMLAATPAWALLDGAASRSRREAGLALATFALCTTVAAGVRSEAALLGVPFLALGVATVLGRPELFDALLSRARRALRALLGAPAPLRVAAVALLLLWPALRTFVTFYPALLLAAVLPPSGDVVRMPLALLAVAPLPIVALAVVGAADSLRAGACRVALSLALISSMAVYFVASHGVGWEMFRYATLSLAAVWLLAVLGWTAIERRAAPSWPPTWRWWGAALVLLASAPIGRRSPSAPAWWDDDARHAPRDIGGALAAQSKQREARFLLAHLRREPRCAFVARVRAGGHRDGEPVLAVFNSEVGLFLVDGSTSPRAAAAQAGAPCARYFWSLDCNAVQGLSCAQDVVGARPVDAWRGRDAPYSDSEEYGALTPELLLGVWSLDEPAAPRAP